MPCLRRPPRLVAKGLLDQRTAEGADAAQGVGEVLAGAGVAGVGEVQGLESKAILFAVQGFPKSRRVTAARTASER